MTLDEFIGAGWRDHGDDAPGVWLRLPEGIPLANDSTDLYKLASLAAHVSGEHLGQWDDGIAFLGRLASVPKFDAASADGKGIYRLQGSLEYCAGRADRADERAAAANPGGDLPPASTRIRMLAVAASALAHHGRLDDAKTALDEALSLASYGPDAKDPAAQALAMTGNNMACEFENLPSRDAGQTAMMLLAAKLGRKYWEIAGGWMQVERAEYRLALSHLKAGLPELALPHAEECLRIVQQNDALPGEHFFAHEALALVRHALDQPDAARKERDAAAEAQPRVVDESFRAYCAGELAKLDATLRL